MSNTRVSSGVMERCTRKRDALSKEVFSTFTAAQQQMYQKIENRDKFRHWEDISYPRHVAGSSTELSRRKRINHVSHSKRATCMLKRKCSAYHTGIFQCFDYVLLQWELVA